MKKDLKSNKKASTSIIKSTAVKVYDHKKVEKKWQNSWEKAKLYQAKDKSTQKKFYGLIEFPYPSGKGLHVGHIRSSTAMDILARKRRREGFNVLYPIGWDAFGLPTENYAIKTGIQPSIVTKNNTDTFRHQLKSLGFSFDWSREIDTTDPKYYKWTQWIFLQLLKKGLAYKAKININWCPTDMIGLANEEVINGRCERCGNPVEKKEKEQWMLAITKYADRLDKDLDTVDYLDKIKIQQRNWIGKSQGAVIKFKMSPSYAIKQDLKLKDIEVFTTRPDTIFGVTYVVLAPEHFSISELLPQVENKEAVWAYIAKARLESETERTDVGKEKTGVELKGIKAINPANNEEVPVWIADYVLADYGSGAVMAVPAHDERDWDFAKKYNLPIKEVIMPVEGEKHEGAYINYGILTNSGKFDGRKSETILKEITAFVGGEWVTKYKLRDWVFSRQRYWGEPIPVVHCKDCGIVPLPEKSLPLKLPKVKNYQPTNTGESPLAAISSWVNTKCPVCKKPAKRETDTMPNWAGSSWYYLRYVDPKNKKAFADKNKLKYWTPVDWYNGGMEHTTLHLLYSRFWHKFLFDQGLVPTSEPYQKRTSHGLILAEGGEKMSKSKGNVVNPDELVATYGADSLRVYEMFIGPFDQPVSWNSDNIVGVRRFLEKVWRLQYLVSEKAGSDKNILALIHQTIAKVSDDIENLRFNTIVSSLMIVANEFEKLGTVSRSDYEILIQLLAPLAPHITEEIWSNLGNRKSIHLSSWPVADLKLAETSEVTIVVQVNGKIRASFKTKKGSTREELENAARSNVDMEKWLENAKILKVIVVPDRLVNFVVS